MRALLLTFTCLCLLSFGTRAGSAQAAAPSSEISADLGTCSALITVTGTDAKPVYDAKITTRVQYGPFGVKKLDLTAFTGADGKVKITHLPETLKKPMAIYVRTANDEEAVDFKPSLQCHATFNVQLQ